MSKRMKRAINHRERRTLRIWMSMVQQSRNFNAFNSVIIRPRSVMWMNNGANAFTPVTDRDSCTNSMTVK